MKTTWTLLLMAMLFSASVGYATPRENGGLVGPAAARLEFYSLGSGIDTELKAAVDNLIQRYKEAGLVHEYTEENGIGFEGEITLCVQLGDLTESQALNQKLFDLVRTSRKTTNLTFVASCKVNQAEGPFKLK